jgi:hypothetical protein
LLLLNFKILIRVLKKTIDRKIKEALGKGTPTEGKVSVRLTSSLR